MSVETLFVGLIILLVGVVIGFLIGSRHTWPRAWVAGHYAGQCDMKERIRKEINDNADAGKFRHPLPRRPEPLGRADAAIHVLPR